MALLASIAVGTARAQSEGGGGTGQASPHEARLEKEAPTQQSRSSYGKRATAVDGTAEISPAQSIVLNQNPSPRLNFDLTGHPQYAGDVNGDGVNDYVYTPDFFSPRDERTSALEDRTGKTALYFGGTPSEAEDQLLYSTLHPVGDLNGDGFDDAVRIDSTAVQVFTGGDTGYQDSGIELTSAGGQFVRGFTDLDGDGTEDAVIVSRSSDQFSVIFGASPLSDAVVRTYQPGSTNLEFRYNTADLDGTGDGAIVRLTGRYNPPEDTARVQIFDVNSTRELISAQDFPAEEIAGRASRYQLSLLDVNGNGQREIVVTRGIDNPSYAFQASQGTYAATPTPLGKDDAVPVGDLDGDGRQDFYTFDDTSRTRYVSYGRGDLASGLTFDTEIPYAASAVGRPEYDPHGGLGDVTGDGRPDVVLSYTDRSAETVGRRFFAVNSSDRTGRTPTDVTYARGHFFDSINETNEIGDFNDDGTTDVAIVRNDLGRVEIFYGGDQISSTPDLTISPPADSLAPSNVSSGDFDGNGTSDLLVGYAPAGRGGVSASPVTKIYFGGDSPDATADHSVFASDVGFTLDLPRAIGDVNDDGATDWMASDRGFTPNQTGQRVAIFFGGSSLPTTADETMEYPEGSFLGEVKAAVGDVNGDGYDDFAFDNTVDRQIDVYFGGDNPSFSPPADLVLSVRPYAGIAGGDYNGDGTSDIAAKPGVAQQNENAAIEIFYGGTNVDTTADRELLVPLNTGIASSDFANPDGDEYANAGYGVLETAGDVNGDGADELLLGSDSFVEGTNALLYQPSTSTEPTRIFRAANQDAALGSQQFIWSTAVGDFTGNGIIDFVATQYDDRNDAYRSSRVYRYPTRLPPPVLSLSRSSITDTLALGDSSRQSIQIENTATGENARVLDYDIQVVTPATTQASLAKAHVPGSDVPIEYDGPLGASEPATDAVGWSSPQDGYDWYCAVGTAGEPITLDVARTSGDIFPNLGVGPGEVSGGAPVSMLPTGFVETTSNSTDSTASLTYTPTSDGVVTIFVSTWTSDQAGGEYALTASGAAEATSCGGGPPWIAVDSTSGQLAAGESESAGVRLSARGTGPGSYEAILRVTSNDPERDTTAVPVSLTIERPPVSLSNPAELPAPGEASTVTVDLPPNTSLNEGTFFYRRAGGGSVGTTTRDLTGVEPGGTVSFTIPDSVVTRAGVQYFVRLSGLLPNGRDALRLTVPSTAPVRTGFLPVQAPQVDAEGGFPEATYRMLSVPADLGDRSVFDVLESQYGSYDPGTWKFARWAPRDSSYRFGSEVDSLRPGEAAWLITSGGDSLTVENVQSADASGLRSIPLASGWNQIGNPFPFPVAWSDVRRPEAVRSLFAYDTTGYQTDASVLDPWKGYFVYNRADTSVTLQVPPVATSDETGENPSLAKRAGAEAGYRLQPVAALHRDGQTLRDPSTWLGFADGAQAGFGPKDRAKPPAVGPHVRLHSVPEEGPALARDFKPRPSDGAVWDLRVGLGLEEPLSSPQEVTVVLNEEGRLPSGFARYVVDRGRGRRLAVTNRSVTVELTPERPSRRLRVIVGTEAFAEANSAGASLRVEETKLRANAPNPFGRSTTIPYQLAEEGQVTIAIYDLLGRRVQTLVDRQQEAGVHQVEWRPGGGEGALASGVYFCRMRAGSYTATRKLVLVR